MLSQIKFSHILHKHTIGLSYTNKNIFSETERERDGNGDGEGPHDNAYSNYKQLDKLHNH